MTTISVSDVQKLAKLSALHVSDDNATMLASELTHILGYVEQLNSVDTTGIEPTYQVNGLSTVTRPDEVVNYGVSQEDLLKNAPDVQDAQVKVPRVLE
jgi:aspartyl-tRNA(Asn)/glutamyl-tRNA(Gln) amidotransferase subunit C